ncbi:MAG: adenylate kinase [Candidatus Ranarchaeia archaeon]
MDNRIFIIAGVPGAGKTTVLNEVKKRVRERFKTVSFGTEMLEYCRSQKLVYNRDDIRKMSLATQRQAQYQTAKRIAALPGDILLDTHCTIKTATGYINGITKDMVLLLKPKAVILIDAHEIEILGRRKKDKKQRNRTIESFEEISEHKIINRIFASIIASHADALLQVVHNRTGEFERAVQEVIKTIEYASTAI